MVNIQEIAAGILRIWVNAAVTNSVIRDASHSARAAVSTSSA
jgi:hypothetical protein